MIARSPFRSRPIPFTDPLQEPQDQPSRAVRWSPPSPLTASGSLAPMWAAGAKTSSHSANDAWRVSAVRPHAAKAPAQRTPAARQAIARYDGIQSLCVRSSATGRQYRFEHTGHTQPIDADDVTLMRRIQDITLL